MELLTFSEEKFKLTNMNTRQERHGDEEVGAVDINFEMDMANGVLSKFSPTLKECFYMQDPKGTPDLIHPDFMPTLRNPQISPIKWDLKIPNAKFSLLDTNDLGDFHFSSVKAGKFEFAFKEGGTVHVKFQVQISEPSGEEIAAIFQLQSKVVKINLTQEVPVELPKTEHNGEGNPNVLPLFGQKDDANVTDVTDNSATAVSDAQEPPTPEELEEDEFARRLAQGIEEDAAFDNALLGAKELLKTSNKVSASIIKRQLKVEQPMAARILVRLEDDGLIGEAADNGTHDVKAA